MADSLNRRKKLLYITYSFPPTNVISAKRSGKMSKYLPEFNWEPLILTANIQDNTGSTDSTEYAGIPISRTTSYSPASSTSKQLKKRAEGASALTRLTNKLKAFVLSLLQRMRPAYRLPILQRILENPIGWYFSARKEGLKIIKDHNIDFEIVPYEHVH